MQSTKTLILHDCFLLCYFSYPKFGIFPRECAIIRTMSEATITEPEAPTEETASPPQAVETASSSQEVEPEEGKAAARERALLEPVSPLEEKIIRQIEFYFGDRNFPKDKFLQQAVHNSDGGWVPLTTLLTFKRLKALSTDMDYIITALLKASSKIVEVDEQGRRIRRTPSLPVPDIFSLDTRLAMKERTIYLKGFDADTQLDELQEFMANFGKTSYIQMRRERDTKAFKGSVFVEFTEKLTADKFLALEEIKFKDVPLLKESKEGYFKRKQEEKKAKKRTTSETSSVDNGVPRDDPNKSGAFPIKGRAPACILRFTGCGPEATWEAVKEAVAEFAAPKFVEFNSDRSGGYVRFSEEGGAKKAKEGLEAAAGDGKPQLCGADTELSVLEGGEEEEYWRNALADMNKGRRPQKKSFSKGFHGRKRKQKYSESHGGDGPPATKVSKSGEGEKEAGGEGSKSGEAQPQEPSTAADTPED